MLRNPDIFTCYRQASPAYEAPHALTAEAVARMLDAVLHRCARGDPDCVRRLELVLDLIAIDRGLPLPFPLTREGGDR